MRRAASEGDNSDLLDVDSSDVEVREIVRVDGESALDEADSRRTNPGRDRSSIPRRTALKTVKQNREPPVNSR